MPVWLLGDCVAEKPVKSEPVPARMVSSSSLTLPADARLHPQRTSACTAMQHQMKHGMTAWKAGLKHVQHRHSHSSTKEVHAWSCSSTAYLPSPVLNMAS